MQSAVLAMIDSVWPSDRPTQSGIKPKRLQLYDHAVFTGG